MQAAAPVYRWVSSGGGWRAMAADMGFANAFTQAGLISPTESKLSAMSSTSGGSWFSTQFFYSSQFLQAVAGSTPVELYAFVYNWMEQYLSLQVDAPTNPKCATFASTIAQLPLKLPFTETDIDDICNVFLDFNGSWAGIVQDMLKAASSNYDDPSFIDRPFDSENRVNALSNTEIYIQTSLSPTSRTQVTATSQGELVYMTAGDSSDEVYTTPLAAQFAVKANYNHFFVAAEDKDTLYTMYATAPETFSEKDYTNFSLYPNTSGSVLKSLPNLPYSTRSPFLEPFGGIPTVTQVAAASSAAIGGLSGDVPSVLAQVASALEYNKTAGFRNLIISDLVKQIYNESIFGDIAVCTQWPNDCGTSDGRLIDGAYTDDLSLALNVGQYQTVDNGDLTKTLKVILTNNNMNTSSNVQFLSYFQTSFNQGIAPGDFLWLPSWSMYGPPAPTPVRSNQIFADYLDDELLTSKLQQLSGTNMTYALMNATTLDNVAFGVKAGQHVELLLLQINSPIPTTVIGRNTTQEYMVPLADMAQAIASNMALISIVRDFTS